MKVVVFIFFLSTLTVTLTAQAPDRSRVTFNKQRTVLPMQYRNNANPVVTVMVNGRGPYKFMFDTGSPDLLKLDQKLVNELKLMAVDSVMAGDGSGTGGRSFPVTVINTLEMGDITIHNANAMVRNYNTRAGMDSIDGVIGMAFFNNVTVELNFENDQLIISKGKLDKADKSVFPSAYINGIPGVKIMLGNKACDAIFDTGNMGGLTMHGSQVDTAMMDGEPRVIGRAQTVVNTFEMKEVRLNNSVSIGDIVFEKPTIVMNDLLTRTNIGVRLARQMNITFDKTNQLVKLVKFAPKTVEANAVSPAVSSSQNDYTGQYGDRSITVGADGFLYIQRPGGMLLKMIEKTKDEFGLEKVPGAILVFERDGSGKVIRIKVSRDGANWEMADRG